jgi:hypothetical protein
MTKQSVRVSLFALFLTASVPILCAQQNSSPAPQSVSGKLSSFEAVSIRPCQDPRIRQVPGDTYPSRGNSSPGRLRTGCYPLLDDNGMGLIRAAYADTFTPINGGPSWIRSAFYEIDAVADGNPSVKTMMGPMMQELLEDRFPSEDPSSGWRGPCLFSRRHA